MVRAGKEISLEVAVADEFATGSGRPDVIVDVRLRRHLRVHALRETIARVLTEIDSRENTSNNNTPNNNNINNNNGNKDNNANNTYSNNANNANNNTAYSNNTATTSSVDYYKSLRELQFFFADDLDGAPLDESKTLAQLQIEDGERLFLAVPHTQTHIESLTETDTHTQGKRNNAKKNNKRRRLSDKLSIFEEEDEIHVDDDEEEDEDEGEEDGSAAAKRKRERKRDKEVALRLFCVTRIPLTDEKDDEDDEEEEVEADGKEGDDNHDDEKDKKNEQQQGKGGEEEGEHEAQQRRVRVRVTRHAQCSLLVRDLCALWRRPQLVLRCGESLILDENKTFAEMGIADGAEIVVTEG